VEYNKRWEFPPVNLEKKTIHFRGYSLPKGLHTVLPAGFLLRSLMLKLLGYPLPPPLVFELCGHLVGTFEEMFGQLHACEGFPWDLYEYGPKKPIWERLEKDVVQNLSRSLVSVSPFMGDVRCFACTLHRLAYNLPGPQGCPYIGQFV
jgi:hypothetical protein